MDDLVGKLPAALEQLKFTHTQNVETQYRSGDTRTPLPLLPLQQSVQLTVLP